MNPPTTLLDHSFLVAVADPADVNHEVAVTTYRALINDFVAERCLLVARADHHAALDKPALFAPIDKLRIAGQHRSAASDRLDQEVDEDLALTLVLLHRNRIRSVATFDDRLRRFDIVTMPTTLIADDQLSN